MSIGLPVPRPVDYWASRFSDDDATERNRKASEALALDFLGRVKYLRERQMPDGPGHSFNAVLRDSHSLIEIGCGTAELTALIHKRYETPVTYASDPGKDAVTVAQRLHPKIRVERFDIMQDWPTHLGNFSLAISAAVHHFPDPQIVIERMLALADRAIVIAPHRWVTARTVPQPATDAFVFESNAWPVRWRALLLEPK